jgi:hypothetical protein
MSQEIAQILTDLVDLKERVEFLEEGMSEKDSEIEVLRSRIYSLDGEEG